MVTTRRDFLKGLLAVVAVPTTVVKVAVDVMSTQEPVRELWKKGKFVWAPHLPMYNQQGLLRRYRDTEIDKSLYGKARVTV